MNTGKTCLGQEWNDSLQYFHLHARLRGDRYRIRNGEKLLFDETQTIAGISMKHFVMGPVLSLFDSSTVRLRVGSVRCSATWELTTMPGQVRMHASARLGQALRLSLSAFIHLADN